MDPYNANLLPIIEINQTNHLSSVLDRFGNYILIWLSDMWITALNLACVHLEQVPNQSLLQSRAALFLGECTVVIPVQSYGRFLLKYKK